VLINGNKCERIDNQCLIAEARTAAPRRQRQGRSANNHLHDNRAT